MASLRDSARDIIYGRQANRWADAGAGSDRLAHLHQQRLAAIADGTDSDGRPYWPQESITLWADIAVEAEQLHAAGEQLGITHQRALQVVELARRVGRLAA